ncbi:MAG: RHS repeat-associated core domain-containing protein [Planctomycetes bacterium]|jgi:RHS repeat-associated protein|nr:RHS repeat-associated core domain-containing protein [Planctomycetota bacterium]
MLKRIGRGVVSGFLVIAFATLATASVGMANVTSSFQAMWAKAAHDLVLAGCPVPDSGQVCPDADSNFSDINDSCSVGVATSYGDALHVNIPTGNVWTKVPVLTLYGGGETTIELHLTYNSLLTGPAYGQATRMGLGWSHGLDFQYLEKQEYRDTFQPGLVQECVQGYVYDCDDCLPCGGEWPCPAPWEPFIHLRCPLPGEEGLDPTQYTGAKSTFISYTPDPIENYRFQSPRIVLIDANGRQEVHNLDTPESTNNGGFPWPNGVGPISSPPWAGSILSWASPASGGESGERFCRTFPDRTKWYYGEFADSRVKRMVTTRGLTTRFTYGQHGITSITDGYGRVIDFEYDASGRLWKVHHPDGLGSVTTLSYTVVGSVSLLESITDPLGHTTSFGYELVGNKYLLTREQLKNGTVYKCDYSQVGELHARTLRVERPVEGGAPVDEDVVQIQSAWFPIINIQKIPEGVSGEVKLVDGRGTVWNYQRNEFLQLVSRSLDGSGLYDTGVSIGHPEGPSPSGGRITSVSDPLGLVTSYSILSRGRIASETKYLNQGPQLTYVTAYKYPDDPTYEPTEPLESYYQAFPSLPVWKQQPDGGIWEYRYNDKGDVAFIRDPLNNEESLAYTYFGDNEGLAPGVLLPGRLKVIEETDRRGVRSVMTYNGAGDLVMKEQFLEPGETPTACITAEYACDLMGRRTLETTHRGDATTTTTKYEYDPMGRMTEMIENFTASPSADPEVFNLTTVYGHDEHGNMTSMVNARGTWTEYKYDHRNRLVRLIEDAGENHFNFETNYVLDGNGNVETMTNAEGDSTSYEYDVGDFLVLVTDAEDYHTRFVRDEMGNTLETKRQRNLQDAEGAWELVETATYDSLSRMLTRTPSDAPTMTYDYGYGSTGGGGGGCGCSSGFGSSVPYKISDGDSPAGITYNEVDLLGRVTKVVRKIGTDNGPTPDSDDSVTVYAYDPEGNLTQLTGPEGEVTDMTYDGVGRMLSRTVSADPFDALATSYLYDGVGNVKQITLPTTHVMNYEYDEADRLKRVYDSEGEIAFYTRDANGNVLTRADGNGNAWTYVYDALDRMAEMHDPLVETPTDNVLKFRYDATGNLIERENRNVNYDPNQGPIQGVKTRYIYDDNDRLRRVVEDYVEADYDENALCGTPGYGEILDESGEGGTQGGGTLQGGGTIQPGGGGGPSTGLSSCSFSTANTVTTYEYDGRHLLKVFDHDCNVTEYFYDAQGRFEGATYPTTCMNCPTPQVKFTYPGLTRKEFTRTDQRKFDATHKFDELGRLAWRQYKKQGFTYRTEEFDYDLTGRLKEANGTYDPDGPLPAFSTIPLVSWARVYDQAGRPMEEWQIHSGTSSQAYETTISYTLNMTEKTLSQEMCYPDCGQRIVGRVWDGRGRVKSANAGSDIGVDWTFDDGNRRISATRRHSQQNESTFAYDVNDRMTSIVHLTGPVPQPPAVAEPAFSIAYGHDAEGNRLFTHHSTQDYADRGEAYGHDNRHRLVKMHRGSLSEDSNGKWSVGSGDYIDHSTLASRQEWVGLDRRGNWLDYREAHSFSSTSPVARYETRVANDVNAYTSIKPDCTVEPEADCQSGCVTTATPAYDVSGNLTFEPLARVSGHAPDYSSAPNQGPGQEYEYDVENRLVRIRRDTNNMSNLATPEPNKLAEYTYDVLGRRVETIDYVDAATGQVMDGVAGRPQPRRTRHVYFGLELIQEYVCDPNWPCGTELPLAREFVHGDPARYPEVVAMITHHLDPVHTENYHYLHDVLGSVIGLVNDAGELVERYTYDPYGKVFIEKWDATANGGAGAWVTSSESTSGLPVSSVGNPFMWTGHRYDAAVGLYATLFRTYSPTLGRWLQRDPIEYAGGSLNLYEYALSGPVLSVDPFGLDSLVKGMCGGPPPPPKDECKSECKRLKIACILTGSDPSYLKLHMECNGCQKRCEKMCEDRKKKNEEYKELNSNFEDKFYKEAASSWWNAGGNAGCSTPTDSWRFVPGYQMSLREQQIIAQTWRNHFWVILLSDTTELCLDVASGRLVRCLHVKLKTPQPSNSVGDWINRFTGIVDLIEDVGDMWEIYRDYGITMPM